MAERLNGIIAALEKGTAFTTFSTPDVESAVSLSTSPYDGVVFEMEHNPWDIRALKDSMQYMLSRSQILSRGSLGPAVTPMVRIPPNGGELNQHFAKQALDIGVYGVIWPHCNTVEQAYNAVAACRYPRLSSAPLYEPQGLRGDAPGTAARYWGLTNQEYYKKADVWPLAPDGEVLVVVMIEDTLGIKNLPDILKNVPGIGVILIGEGDLTQELGIPRQYDHPEAVAAMGQIVATCKQFDVPVGHPHVDNNNVERIVSQGYRFLMAAPLRSYSPVEKGFQLTGRS